MYCPKCGIRLSDAQKKCPLCLTLLPSEQGEGTVRFYPDLPRPKDRKDFRGLIFLITLFFLAGGGICLAMDLVLNGTLSFSPYVLASLVLFYAAFLLPRWFFRPNPVIFLPVFFFCLILFLLYLDLANSGGWFLSFAFPVCGGILIILETVVTLMFYVRKGSLYIIGSALLAFGILSFVSEILFRATFSMPIRLTWSLVPLILLSVMGVGLIVIAIVPPFRRFLGKRFFV